MQSLTGSSPDIADGYIAIGQILRPWGVRGEVKVALHTDFPERFQQLELVYLGPEARPVPVLASRMHQGQALLRLEGYDTPEAAEALRNLWIQVPQDQLMPLPEDEHYVFEMIGVHVVTTDGRDLGEIAEVLITSANDVLVIRSATGEILIPYIDDVVAEEDLPARRIVIRPLPGLLD
jgi:16S rRNA processing protein RimM